MDSVASVFLVDTVPRRPSSAASPRASAIAYLIRIVALTLAMIVGWMGMTVGYFVFLVN